MPHNLTQADYDSEPVRYCSKCYSLKIKYEESVDMEYCDDCGSLDILEAPIEEWEAKYERRYNKRFAVKNNNPKDSYIFKMPIEKLKTKVFESPKWKEIIHAVYPSFPGGLSRADSVIMFFDNLIKHNKLDDLRLFLYNHTNY